MDQRNFRVITIDKVVGNNLFYHDTSHDHTLGKFLIFNMKILQKQITQEITYKLLHYTKRTVAQMDLLQVSLAEKEQKEKMRERPVILGILINIHELSSLASIFKMTGLLSTFSLKLELAIVKEHSRASLCCIIVLSEDMIGYWFFFVKGCRLNWTESCPANDPGYQGLQVSLAFIPSPIFATRETCSNSVPQRVGGHDNPAATQNYTPLEKEY